MSDANLPAPAFCTAVDLHYFPRALALYRSLEDLSREFRLHLLCMEPGVRELAERLELAHALTYDIDDVEGADPALREVRGSRSRVEYCWTVKPSLCLYLLDREPSIGPVTYLDSDLMFFDDPHLLLAELDGGSVLLLPHRFPPEHPEWTESDGIFNGGWLTFAADGRARMALQWWRERCLEWCFDRREDGKFADQHYLDDWPERFDGVRVIEHPGAGLAPWNASVHKLERCEGRLLVDGQPLVFHHYQSLRLLAAPRVLRRLTLRSHGYRFVREPARQLWWTAPGYALAEEDVDLLWRPYLKRLLQAFAEVRAVEPAFGAGLDSLQPAEVGRQLLRRLVPRPVRRALRRIAA